MSFSNGVVVAAAGGDNDNDNDNDAADMEQRNSESSWVLYIKNELKEAEHRQRAPNPSIFLASSPLRGLKLEAFIPQVVSIGPYHNDLGPHHSSFPDTLETGRYKLIAAQEMAKHKVVAAYLVGRCFPGADLMALADRLKSIAADIRAEYDTDLAHCAARGDEKLAYMMAVDAAFVVEFLRCNASYSSSSSEEQEAEEEESKAVLVDVDSGAPTDRSRSRSTSTSTSKLREAMYKGYFSSRFPRPLRKSILQDLVLLENQLPMKVLWEVVRLDQRCRNGEAEAEAVLGFLVKDFAAEALPFPGLSPRVLEHALKQVKQKKHLLDCLYAIVTSTLKGGSHAYKEVCVSPDDDSRVEQKPTHFPSASELYNCGIHLKASRETEAGNMSSIWYDAASTTLYIPRVRVGDDTERLFRNLIAYESHLIDKVSVVSYFRFMNGLVDTAEDVALLVQRGILAQDIGSNHDVAQMWNNLCINTMRVCSESHELIARKLSAHCQSRTNAWKAEFKRTYLSRPWLLISVISAAALLIMTFVITYYTALIYVSGEG